MKQNNKRVEWSDVISQNRVKTMIARVFLTGIIGGCMLFQIGSVQAQEEAAEAAGEKAEAPADAKSTVDEPLAPTPNDGGTYAVSELEIAYALDHPQLPPIEELLDIEIVLAQTDDGKYVSWRPGMEQVRTTLGEFPDGTHYASSIVLVSRAIVAEFSRRGFMGVYVGPDAEQINNQGKDIRKDGNKVMRMVIRVGVVSSARTIAAGERVDPEERINHPLHDRLLKQSPVRPPMEGDVERRDLIRKDQLDRYLSFLNRHPGRRIDAAVSPGEEPGTVAVDYLVSENRPWLMYYQIANTGTKATDEWRHRIGYLNHQLTNNDDILSIDYVTGGFDDDANALITSYEAPFSDDGRIRYKVGYQYSDYEASDVGFANEKFSGNEHGLNGELMFNVHQNDKFFLDLIGGINYRVIEVDNNGLKPGHTEQFILPYAGLQFEERTMTSDLLGKVTVEKWMSDWTSQFQGNVGDERGALDLLGRLRPDEDWILLKYDISLSFYLEPLLNREAWTDTSTPDTSTLAHEIAIGFKGQHVVGDERLTPQFERTAGGLYSVRGYEESVVVGDDVNLISIEYRYHVPRAFGIDPDPDQTPMFGQPFRWAPQSVYGRPDWDLILRVFADYGQVDNNGPQVFEADQHLFSVGVGAELLVKRNFNLRVDWGFAQEELRTNNPNSRVFTSSGSSKVHIVGTIIY